MSHSNAMQSRLKDASPLLIGVIGAMEEEVTYLRDQLDNRKDQTIGGYEFYQGKLAGQEVILSKSGIGKVNAAIATTLMLQVFQPDCVINTGSAGGFGADLNIGDVVISSEVRQHDFDLTVFGYEHGQVPQMPAAFTPDPLLVTIAEQSIEKIDQGRVVMGLIATGDCFMNDPAKVEHTRSLFPNMLAVEMEAGAIAQVCFRFDIPFIIFRALSDIAGKESSISFNEFLEQAGVQSANRVIDMIQALGQQQKAV